MQSLFLWTGLLAWGVQVFAQPRFDEWFEPSVLRIDWTLCGTDTTTHAYLAGLKKQPGWGGARLQLLDTLDYGSYKVVVKDKSSGQPVYTRGFSTLFEEWQTTAEAERFPKAFPQVIEVPYPKAPCSVTIYFRSKSQRWGTLLSFEVDPRSVGIEQVSGTIHEVKRISGNGNPERSVDLAFVAEGYTNDQLGKFYSDVERLSAFLLKQEPFNRYADRFNVWAIGVPSQESGTDDPNRGIWKNTAFNSGFNTFGTDRYLETFDLPAIHNATRGVPHDHIIVVVNTDKYGGGGVYNHFSLSSADNKLSPIVLVHELGHGFGGLGDEYYSSEVAYTDYIDLSAEPWEPNLTTLVAFDKKWKRLVDGNTPVPTPDQRSFEDVVGVFEGGGYTAKGVYRPALDCRMKSNVAPRFCKVCQLSIENVIKSLTE
ncbi:MAG: M64 family metallopeptidase [Breznakibacter sp.]